VNLGDVGDSLAQVDIAQLDIDLDPIAFGDLLFHDFGIGHWHRPCLSGARLERNCMLSVIDIYDRTRKGGCGFADKHSCDSCPKQTDYCDYDLWFLHEAPPS
jgi:hypothetical protein